MKSSISHQIKHREKPNDEFWTPNDLVKELLKLTPFEKQDSLFDSAFGTGRFFNNFPKESKKGYSTDFFEETENWDWIITNPPYSKLDDWIKQTCKLSNKGFALLIGTQNITPKRIELIESFGFGITHIYMFKVFKWYGISSYIICEKGKKSIIDYNRKVWYDTEDGNSSQK